MKNPCEQIYYERERFLVNLRKSKRQESNKNKRKLYGGKIKSDEFEIKILIDRALFHLETAENLNQAPSFWQSLRALNTLDLIPNILDILTKSIQMKEKLLEPVYLELFAQLCEKKEWSKLMLDKRVLELLCDLIGFGSKDEEILKIIIEVCENCPQAAELLVELGIFELFELVVQDNKQLAELCAYFMYRIILHSSETLPDVTFYVAVGICEKFLGYRNTKIWIYHSVYFITQRKNCEELAQFLFDDLFQDLNNRKNPDLLIKIVINLTAGPDFLVKTLLKHQLLDILYIYLTVYEIPIQKDILIVLSNIAGGDTSSITSFICHKVYKKFIQFIDSPNYELRYESSIVLKCLAMQASHIHFTAIPNKELFCALSSAVGKDFEVDRNLLHFLQNLLDCDNYFPETREMFIESGCKDKVEKISFKRDVIGLSAEKVLKNFDEYENLIF